MLTRIAVLVSGGGTNLQALLDAQKSGLLTDGEIVLVVSNRPGAYALTRASQAGVPGVLLTRAECGGADAWEEALLDLLEKNQIDLIVLAGFLSILSERVIRRYPRRILNVHPSLIPAFSGKGYYGLRVHEAVLERGVKVTGATVHFVNEIPDGGEILLQKPVAVRKDETPESLQHRVMQTAEWQILPRAVQQVSRDIRKEKLTCPSTAPIA